MCIMLKPNQSQGSWSNNVKNHEINPLKGSLSKKNQSYTFIKLKSLILNNHLSQTQPIIWKLECSYKKGGVLCTQNQLQKHHVHIHTKHPYCTNAFPLHNTVIKEVNIPMSFRNRSERNQGLVPELLRGLPLLK